MRQSLHVEIPGDLSVGLFAEIKEFGGTVSLLTDAQDQRPIGW